MRTLTLDRDRYAVLYQGMLVGDGYAGAETRLAARILTKLENFPAEYDEETKLWGLKDDRSFTVTLEESEFSMVRNAAYKVRWVGRFVRKAAEVLDWLDAVKEDRLHAVVTEEDRPRATP